MSSKCGKQLEAFGLKCSECFFPSVQQKCWICLWCVSCYLHCVWWNGEMKGLAGWVGWNNARCLCVRNETFQLKKKKQHTCTHKIKTFCLHTKRLTITCLLWTMVAFNFCFQANTKKKVCWMKKTTRCVQILISPSTQSHPKNHVKQHK